MKTIREAAKTAGISVRTLHYYDQIGLLRPSAVTPAGYRLYDDTAMSRLMQVLFYRELDFSLADIRAILDDPAFTIDRALQQHRALLVSKRDRLDRLIRLTDSLRKGGDTMGFEAFDTGEIDALRQQYADEARERWGTTAAYAQSAQKTRSYGKAEWEQIQAEADRILAAVAACRPNGPQTDEVQGLIAEWQAHITRNYYDCTADIFAGLGEMYVQDERFRQHLDGRYGDGFAAFLSEAIGCFCTAS